jgi:hypothetical protein
MIFTHNYVLILRNHQNNSVRRLSYRPLELCRKLDADCLLPPCVRFGVRTATTIPSMRFQGPSMDGCALPHVIPKDK